MLCGSVFVDDVMKLTGQNQRRRVCFVPVRQVTPLHGGEVSDNDCRLVTVNVHLDYSFFRQISLR